ncbi:hypothetical protein LCGC14_1052640 [marine sediment metagenome]|uniref:Uncharacterized protein n=1 Tax=marine sediment metagenome TaxID=412755 RepID=A0A0F9MSV5_9ZZZZ
MIPTKSIYTYKELYYLIDNGKLLKTLSEIEKLLVRYHYYNDTLRLYWRKL